jgi:serine/threonine-protein kinase
MDVGPNFLVPGGALSGPLFARLLYERDAVAALPPGTLVGRYRVVEIVGRGGSSVVYRADRDDGEFDQTVALKVVRSEPRLRDYLHRKETFSGC